MALGDFRQNAASTGRSQTSSNTYQPKLQLATPALPAGDYLLTFSFLYQTSATEDNEVQCRIVEDIAGPATVAYETGELREANPGNAPGDSQDACVVAIRRTLAAGAHTFDFEFRRTGAVQLVTVEEVRMTFFQLDASYQEASADAYTTTTSTSYVLKASLNTGAIPAGVYNVRMSVEYTNDDPGGGDDGGLWFRMRRDPAGADVNTDLLGSDVGAGSELQVAQGGWGTGPTLPRGCAAWEVPCLELEADTYQFELLYRAVNGLADDFGTALARLTFWRMS